MTPDNSNASYNADIQRVQDIINEIDKGCDIDRMLELVNEAAALIRKCQEKLAKTGVEIEEALRFINPDTPQA